MKSVIPLLIGFLLLAISACSPSLSPFTQRLVEQNRWAEEDLKEIQFYLSKDIVLYKNHTTGSSRIESGEIKMVQGRKIEEIRIPKGTPGIAIYQPKKDKLAVSFESQNDRYLIFGPNPKKGGSYVLLATDWKNNRGKVKYDDQQYYTTRESGFASLLVNLKESKKVRVKSRSAKGRTVN